MVRRLQIYEGTPPYAWSPAGTTRGCYHVADCIPYAALCIPGTVL